MDFISIEYYTLFLPIVVLLVFNFRKNLNRQILILLFASYFFFIFASGWHILLLLTSTLVDWISGGKIHNSASQETRKRWLIGSLSVNLGLLCLFKYLDFFISTFNLITVRIGQRVEWQGFDLLLPVGISFYTFQTMSYTIDIYRKKHEP